MRPSALLVMLGLALFVGLVPFGDAACPDADCNGNSSDDGRPHDVCCSCCVHTRVDPVLEAVFLPQDQSPERLCAVGTIFLPRPDPREILHVPKPFLFS